MRLHVRKLPISIVRPVHRTRSIIPDRSDECDWSVLLGSCGPDSFDGLFHLTDYPAVHRVLLAMHRYLYITCSLRAYLIVSYCVDRIVARKDCCSRAPVGGIDHDPRSHSHSCNGSFRFTPSQSGHAADDMRIAERSCSILPSDPDPGMLPPSVDYFLCTTWRYS